MDRKGFEKISRTLEGSPIGEVDIIPTPEEGEDIRFLTIRPHDRTRPADILNVLDEAELIYEELEEIEADDKDPSLKPLAADAFALTLEDKNCR